MPLAAKCWSRASEVPRQLTVWLFGRFVGTLAQVDGRLGFGYSPEWLAQTDAVSLSQSLPLQPAPFDDRATRPFFAGLLPEGDKRKQVAQALHVSRQNDFALLDGIGGECAGAVTLLESGQTPPAGAIENAVQWLTNAELVAAIDDMPRRPMLAGAQDMRLSLAGAQDKLPVVVRFASGGVQIGLPRFGSPSTHILKPAIPGIEGSVFNEGFCMALARALQLDVANAAIHRVQDGSEQREFLLVQRYDRQQAPADPAARSSAWVRLHQEDFCQALSYPPETKYQNEGGPDLAQAFDRAGFVGQAHHQREAPAAFDDLRDLLALDQALQRGQHLLFDLQIDQARDGGQPGLQDVGLAAQRIQVFAEDLDRNLRTHTREHVVDAVRDRLADFQRRRQVHQARADVGPNLVHAACQFSRGFQAHEFADMHAFCMLVEFSAATAPPHVRHFRYLADQHLGLARQCR